MDRGARCLGVAALGLLGLAAPDRVAAEAVAINLLHDTRFQTGGVCGFDFQVEATANVAEVSVTYRVTIPEEAEIACQMRSSPYALAVVSCDSPRRLTDPCPPDVRLVASPPRCRDKGGDTIDCGRVLLSARGPETFELE